MYCATKILKEQIKVTRNDSAKLLQKSQIASETVEFLHRFGLDVVGNVDIRFHCLVVAMASPFHDYLSRYTQCPSTTDECSSASIITYQLVLGFDNIDSFISLIEGLAYRLVNLCQYAELMQIGVHLLIADYR